MNKFKKLLKIFGYGVVAIIVLFYLGRFCLFEIINVANPRVILGQVVSPQKGYILTVYNLNPLLITGGDTTIILHLRRFNENMEYLKFNPFTGKVFHPEGDIFLLRGNLFPMGVVWKDEKNLLINVMTKKENRKNLMGFLERRALQVKKRFGDVDISYGSLDERVYPNEVRILNITSAEEEDKHSVRVW
jgi:hypothetical protein